MKNIKKVLSLVLTALIALSMMTTVFAAPATTTPTLEGHTYKAYKIFTGTQANTSNHEPLGEIEWANEAKGAELLSAIQGYGTIGPKFAGCTSAADVAKILSDNSFTAEDAKEFAACMNLNLDKLVDCGEAKANQDPIDPGYYLVVDVTANIGEGDARNLALLQQTKHGTFEIATKVTVPGVEKVIETPTADLIYNDESFGRKIDYKITGTMPSELESYKTYAYWFEDKMDKGLTFIDGSLKVYIVNGNDEHEATDLFWKDVSTYSEKDGTTIKVATHDVKGFNLNGVVDSDGKTYHVDKDTQIVVKYSAYINENAYIGGEIPNTVRLKYENNPNNNGIPTPPDDKEPKEPEGVTPESKVRSYTTELTILKLDGSKTDKTPLTGAEFTLSGDGLYDVKITTGEAYVLATGTEVGTHYKLKDGTYTTTDPITDGSDQDTSKYYETLTKDYLKKSFVEAHNVPDDNRTAAGTKVSAFVDDQGRVTFTGLKSGNYTLSETVVPKGFNKVADINFNILFRYDATTNKGDFYTDSSEIQINPAKENTFYTEIENYPGSLLPETGGMGTKMFYIFGSIMVLGAGVLLVAKKRMNA